MSEPSTYKNTRTMKLDVTQEQERRDRAKGIHAQFVCIREDHIGDKAFFNIIKNKKLTYLVKIRKAPAIDDYCTCGDFLNRNTEDFKNEHGYALQCKHICASRIMVGWDQ